MARWYYEAEFHPLEAGHPTKVFGFEADSKALALDHVAQCIMDPTFLDEEVGYTLACVTGKFRLSKYEDVPPEAGVLRVKAWD